MSFETALVELANARGGGQRGNRAAVSMLESALNSGRIQPHDVSLLALAHACYGDDWYRQLHAEQTGRPQSVAMIEAGDSGGAGAMNSTLFPNLTGQLLFSVMLPEYEAPDFLASRLAETIRTRLKTEVIPGLSSIGNQIQEVGEGQPFGTMGFSENTLTTAETKKRGGVIKVTKEAVFHGQDGQILRKARMAGEAMGLDKEERVLDMVLGDTGISGLYNRNGTTYNTYLNAGAYVNSGTTALTDFSSLEAAYDLQVDITDPDTGKRIRWRPTALLCVPQIEQEALRITGATMLGYESDPSAAANRQTMGPNLPRYRMPVLSSPIVYDRVRTKIQTQNAAKAKAFWWIGNFMKAFAYMENWGMQVSQAARNSDAAFYNDVEYAFKVSEKGNAQVMDPRHVVRMGDTTA